MSSLIALVINIPGHRCAVNTPDRIVKFDSLQTSIALSILFFDALSLIIILCIVHKRQRWFMTDRKASNPHWLILEVAKIAWHNSKPVYRSAFTFCENECLCRLDFGKRRYGGPFSIEQIENVKVFLQILKVLYFYWSHFFTSYVIIIESCSTSL